MLIDLLVGCEALHLPLSKEPNFIRKNKVMNKPLLYFFLKIKPPPHDFDDKFVRCCARLWFGFIAEVTKHDIACETLVSPYDFTLHTRDLVGRRQQTLGS